MQTPRLQPSLLAAFSILAGVKGPRDPFTVLGSAFCKWNPFPPPVELDVDSKVPWAADPRAHTSWGAHGFPAESPGPQAGRPHSWLPWLWALCVYGGHAAISAVTNMQYHAGVCGWDTLGTVRSLPATGTDRPPADSLPGLATPSSLSSLHCSLLSGVPGPALCLMWVAGPTAGATVSAGETGLEPPAGGHGT